MPSPSSTDNPPTTDPSPPYTSSFSSKWLPISWTRTEIPNSDPNHTDPQPKTRIELKVPPRLLSLPPTIFIVTASIGFIRGSRAAGLRYLAENAHRPPRTVQGWYFYQKTKNYRVLFAGLKDAGKDGLRGLAVGTAWVGVEYYWGEVLGSGSFLNGSKWFAETARNTNELAAGVVTSSLVSALYKLGWRTSMRTVVFGGLIGGIIQVLMGLKQGLQESVAYQKAEKQKQEDVSKST